MHGRPTLSLVGRPRVLPGLAAWLFSWISDVTDLWFSGLSALGYIGCLVLWLYLTTHVFLCRCGSMMWQRGSAGWLGGQGKGSADPATRFGDPVGGRAARTHGRPTQPLRQRCSSLVLDMFSAILCAFWYLHPDIHTKLVELISSKG